MTNTLGQSRVPPRLPEGRYPQQTTKWCSTPRGDSRLRTSRVHCGGDSNRDASWALVTRGTPLPRPSPFPRRPCLSTGGPFPQPKRKTPHPYVCPCGEGREREGRKGEERRERGQGQGAGWVSVWRSGVCSSASPLIGSSSWRLFFLHGFSFSASLLPPRLRLLLGGGAGGGDDGGTGVAGMVLWWWRWWSSSCWA